MPLLVDTNPQNYSGDSFARASDSRPVEPSETTALLQNKQRLKKATRRKLGRESKMRKRRIVVALILAEVFERVTYYGVLTNLVLFLNSNFHWHMLSSASAVFIFLCLSSFMSAVGGFVADSRFGRYGVISSGFVVYLLGTIFLVVVAAWLDYRRRYNLTAPVIPWLVLVLLCIACGQGALKANLSAFGADQLQSVKPSKSSRIFFNWFYWLANVGAILVLLGITYIQQMNRKYGFLAGFGLLAISLTVAMASFLSCRKYYAVSDPRGTGLRHMWLIVKQAWSKRHDNIVSRYVCVIHIGYVGQDYMYAEGGEGRVGWRGSQPSLTKDMFFRQQFFTQYHYFGLLKRILSQFCTCMGSRKIEELGAKTA